MGTNEPALPDLLLRGDDREGEQLLQDVHFLDQRENQKDICRQKHVWLSTYQVIWSKFYRQSWAYGGVCNPWHASRRYKHGEQFWEFKIYLIYDIKSLNFNIINVLNIAQYLCLVKSVGPLCIKHYITITQYTHPTIWDSLQKVKKIKNIHDFTIFKNTLTLSRLISILSRLLLTSNLPCIKYKYIYFLLVYNNIYL